MRKMDADMELELELEANTQLMTEGFCYHPDGTIYFNFRNVDPTAYIPAFDNDAETILESAERRQDKDDIVEIVRMFYGDKAVQLLRKHERAPFQFVDIHNQGISMKKWIDEELT